jgi:hypothetical protein
VDELLSQLQSSPSPSTRSKSLEILVLKARTLCSAATGRTGGHLQPVTHDTPEVSFGFEMTNFNHVFSLIELRDIVCDYRRLSGCLGFWNAKFFEDAKRALDKMSAQSHSLVSVVEDAGQLESLGLKGDVKGAIIQDVATSLSPYKLRVGIWEKILKQ